MAACSLTRPFTLTIPYICCISCCSLFCILLRMLLLLMWRITI